VTQLLSSLYFSVDRIIAASRIRNAAQLDRRTYFRFLMDSKSSDQRRARQLRSSTPYATRMVMRCCCFGPVSCSSAEEIVKTRTL